MRKLALGGGPPLSAPVQARLDWAYRALRTIEQASQENDVSDVGQNFTFDAAVTPTTALSHVPYVALGSGRLLALGCLWHGGTAVEAVLAGIAHDIASGGKVQSVRLKT